MELKTYQRRAVDALRQFLDRAKVSEPGAAFAATVDTPGEDYRLITNDAGEVLTSLSPVPYVCLRIPTGGGKTVLGAHIIRAAETYLGREFPVVLWLVPSRQIKEQTLEAFRDPRHPYRRELDEAFSGRVNVFDIADNGMIRPSDIADGLCLVIGTMATARVADTEIRDFYAHKEDLEPHFIGMVGHEGLDLIEAGKPKFSFANLLRIHRPLIITDEAHNANTGLAYTVYERLSPSAIIELTATPDVKTSNILVRVSASELKAEAMIKLPVILKEHHDGWEECLQAALQRRAYLEEIAAGENPDYVRPILLIRAENKGGVATVDVVRQHLIENELIPEDHIEVATGESPLSASLDLFSPTCPVRVIITKDALKEGWDCSFAYVLCSLAQQKSATAIEQLLGRVLRMPYARLRKHPELNRAYSHVVSSSYGQAAREFTDELEAMGFNPVEAAEAVQPDLDLKHGGGGGLLEEVSVLVLDQAPDLSSIPDADRERVIIEPRRDAKPGVEVTIKGAIDTTTQDAIVATLDRSLRAEAKRRLNLHNIRANYKSTPASRQVEFKVPRLLLRQGSLLLDIDPDILLDAQGWDINDYPADLSTFAYNPATKTFSLDIHGDTVEWEETPEPQVAYMKGLAGAWTIDELALFIDRRIRALDIPQPRLLAWIRMGLQSLLDRGFSLEQLVRGKFILARMLHARVGLARQEASKSTYQDVMFGDAPPVEAPMSHAFAFDPNSYPQRWLCPSTHRWKKHYYAVPGELPHKRSGNKTAEEYDCALVIDSLPEVETWVRNLDKRQFWIPGHPHNAYPDFVAKLTDGRVLVVEYKGGDRVSNDDSKKKNLMGLLWQKTSRGKGIYLMAMPASVHPKGWSIEEQIKKAIWAGVE
ncbi:DEAD/DEAH box helicase [Arenimonas sp.]|uniref:DEAD/DEAH box helicase n=1 Tax=Arenimonas sp. TaxID=1872635 RepID=UPI0035AFD611